MQYPYTAPMGTTFQITASGTAKSINPEHSIQSNRILLSASAAGAYVGFGAATTTSNGFPIPALSTGNFLELWVKDTGILFIVGAGTVYVLAEQPV